MFRSLLNRIYMSTVASLWSNTTGYTEYARSPIGNHIEKKNLHNIWLFGWFTILKQSLMLFKLLFVEDDWCIFNIAILMDYFCFCFFLLSLTKLTANLMAWEEHVQYLFQTPLFSNVLSHLLFWLFLPLLIAVDISFSYS